MNAVHRDGPDVALEVHVLTELPPFCDTEQSQFCPVVSCQVLHSHLGVFLSIQEQGIRTLKSSTSIEAQACRISKSWPRSEFRNPLAVGPKYCSGTAIRLLALMSSLPGRCAAIPSEEI